jgi:hypothetical protein
MQLLSSVHDSQKNTYVLLYETKERKEGAKIRVTQRIKVQGKINTAFKSAMYTA